jgi:hypothetical protein
MLNKTETLAFSAMILVTFSLLSPLFIAAAAGWSNGGYSANPANPDYGTHDWIADHALDWLPQPEKQLLLDNKALYLYGTELPDNGQAPDGIGDTTKHHVYFHSGGSPQDDSAAVRARDEYMKAVNALNAGNLSDAAKELGIVTHYIADMAVYAHVMAASTAWREEHHHSDYEDYVDTRTNSYQDTFNNYLEFDGDLTSKTAYNATLGLAYNSTFGDDGTLTCVWMDENYNWSDATFRDRAGESLNLAVNAVADVLHTFWVQNSPVIPELFTHSAIVMFLCLSLLVVLWVKKKARRE